MNVSVILPDQALGIAGLIPHFHLTRSLVFYRNQDIRHDVPVILYVWTLFHKSAVVYKEESLITKILFYFNSKLELHLQS